jgi:hypothetical protein
MTELIRTKRDGCWQVRSNSWGAFLQPADDPLAEATLDKGAMDRFELNADIAPIPADLWSRWVQLCFHFCDKVRSEVEVSCRLLRREDDKSQWRILVPAQDVNGASVRIASFDEAIDIATGEVIAEYPPQGWVPCGSSHSHNTMALDRFSSTDDHYELGDPGLHIVISHIDPAKRTYRATASITANKRRFYLDDCQAVADLKAAPGVSFHPDVLQLIQLDALKPLTFQSLALKGKAAQWPGTSLYTHPNAGNGYSRQDLGDDPLWWALDEANFRSEPSATDTFNHPLCNQIIQHVNAQIRRGHDEAVTDFLWELHDLVEHLQSELSAIDNDVLSDSANSADTSHPATTGGLLPGEW